MPIPSYPTITAGVLTIEDINQAIVCEHKRLASHSITRSHPMAAHPTKDHRMFPTGPRIAIVIGRWEVEQLDQIALEVSLTKDGAARAKELGFCPNDFWTHCKWAGLEVIRLDEESHLEVIIDDR